MTFGRYFMSDPTDIHKMQRNGIVMCSEVSFHKLQPLSIKDKNLCSSLITTELRRNGFQIDSTDFVEVEMDTHLYPYINQLFKNICLKRNHLLINMKTMEVNILRWWSNHIIGGIGGYIGYSFLKHLFCAKHYQGINLNAFYALYPNLHRIEVFDLNSISSCFLDDIHQFLSNNKDSKVDHIELHICLHIKDSNIFDQCNIYESKFKSIGFETVAEKQYPVYKTQCLVLRQRDETDPTVSPDLARALQLWKNIIAHLYQTAQ